MNTTADATAEAGSDRFDTLVLITRPPYQGRRSEEVLEAVMSLALFDRDHAVVFFDQGLGWLAEGQAPGDSKSLSKQLSALPMYGSEALFYCAGHQHRVLGQTVSRDDVQACSLAQLAHWLRQARYVEVF
ncbi:DsrE family protein [Saccharospirillum impatiens]|uniref:DsrE family protein n=1 Tax=Saccharospirillum impatiens TaxID=169438 RepID=UPI0003FA0659|nr:DsrE family protein [Saccharospirillum impatiens]